MSILPTELWYLIIGEIVNTSAPFVFNVDIEQLEPNLVMSKNPRMRFHYVVNPPTTQVDHASWPGTYETQISKTIRSLLLTNKLINNELCKGVQRLQGVITTVSGRGKIRFNPQRHIICIRNVNYNDQDAPWTDLNFEIEHLAFMGGTRSTDFRLLRCAFPGTRQIYGVFVDSVRIRPDKPIDVIWPARDRHNLPLALLHRANGALINLRYNLFSPGLDWEIAAMAKLPRLPFLRLVLI